MAVDNDTEVRNLAQAMMDEYLDTKETFPMEIREQIASEYRRMWAEKMKWLEEHKKEEQP